MPFSPHSSRKVFCCRILANIIPIKVQLASTGQLIVQLSTTSVYSAKFGIACPIDEQDFSPLNGTILRDSLQKLYHQHVVKVLIIETTSINENK